MIISPRSKYLNGCKLHVGARIIKIKNHTGLHCESCIEEKRILKEKKFIERSNKLHNNRYIYDKVFYECNSKKVTIICKVHGEFNQMPSNHIRGQGCDKCLNQSLAYTHDEIILKFNETHGLVYDYDKVSYVNWKTPVIIKCKKHGEFKQSPGKHLGGQGCPKCKMSHGERKIEMFLIQHNIQYEHQKKFIDCIGLNKNKCKYDFYIPSLNLLIEFDGEQHFKPRFDITTKENAVKRFKRLQELDKYKTWYAKKNKIRLIRIPYTKLKTIDKLLREIFSK